MRARPFWQMFFFLRHYSRFSAILFVRNLFSSSDPLLRSPPRVHFRARALSSSINTFSPYCRSRDRYGVFLSGKIYLSIGKIAFGKGGVPTFEGARDLASPSEFRTVSV